MRLYGIMQLPREANGQAVAQLLRDQAMSSQDYAIPTGLSYANSCRLTKGMEEKEGLEKELGGKS